MPTKYSTPILVVNIKRQFFADILAQPRRKWVEYRVMSEYWERRLENVGKAPFNLRLLNGMTPPVPEATVRVEKVLRRKSTKTIELYLGRILSVKHWDRKNELSNKVSYREPFSNEGIALREWQPVRGRSSSA